MSEIKVKEKSKIAIIPLIMMIIGVIAICYGIYNFNYANSHVWGDPGSFSDRTHKAPYIQKGNVFTVAGGICTFFGVIFYFSKSKKTTILKTDNINNLDEIKKLKDLLDSGAISQEEYDNKKQELLNKI